MIPGFADALSRKYDILQQQANTAQTAGAAQAGLAGAQAGQVAAQTGTVAPESKARVGLFGSEAAKNTAEANLNQDNLFPVSEVARRYGWLQANNAGAFGPGQPFGGPLAPNSSSFQTQPTNDINPPPLGQYAAGTPSVPGHGSSKVDTVPAMLAPREAVLNEHGADLIGREHIAIANAIGNHIASAGGPQGGPPAGKPAAAKKGMTPPRGNAGPGASVKRSEPAPKHQALSKGTHMVGHGKSAKTPAKINPAALMGMLGSLNPGGGVPMGPGGTPGAAPVVGNS